jgi:hypothetical protein
MGKQTISYYGSGRILYVTTGDQPLVDALALNYAQGKALPPAAAAPGAGFPAPPEGYVGVRTLRTGQSFYETFEDAAYFEALESLLTVSA